MRGASTLRWLKNGVELKEGADGGRIKGVHTPTLLITRLVGRDTDQKVWCDRMAERGWTVPTWPKEYGGGGLSKEEAKVLAQEMARISARRPLDSFGISMLGPALLKFGTEEQKKEHLPPIVRGEIRWCQGYSEPNAGSDLASLATRARPARRPIDPEPRG